MNVVGFSHPYLKLHGQTWGWLLAVRDCEEEQCLPGPEGLAYDTAYPDPEDPSRPPRTYALELSPETRMVQLVFIGNKQIPFTTYRLLHPPSDPLRNYALFLGRPFAFKLRGEPVPSEVVRRLDLVSGNQDSLFVTD